MENGQNGTIELPAVLPIRLVVEIRAAIDAANAGALDRLRDRLIYNTEEASRGPLAVYLVECLKDLIAVVADRQKTINSLAAREAQTAAAMRAAEEAINEVEAVMANVDRKIGDVARIIVIANERLARR